MPRRRPVKQAEASPRAASFIFTLFGDFVLAANPPGLPARSLVALGASFGFSAETVRQAISRLTRQGWLRVRKNGRFASYALTERGAERVRALSPRIYGPLVEWDGRWRFLIYRISERRRETRDALRKDLAVLGWAPLSASVWVSPTADLRTAENAARENGAEKEVDLFLCEYRGPRSDAELVRQCWDVEAIAARYRNFINEYRPRLAGAKKQLTEEAAFAQRVRLVHDFRKFTYLDPGLPSALLPAHWPGSIASAIFHEYYALLKPKADRFFKGVEIDDR